MQKQATLFVFCGLVATAFGQFGGQQIQNGFAALRGNDDSNILRVNGNNGVQFIGSDRLNAQDENVNAINSVRNAAQEQVTEVTCGDHDLDLSLHCGGENDWNCECSEGFVHVPTARFSRTVIEGNTTQTIPLQAVSTNTTETTDRCWENNQEGERNINKRAGFSFNGTLESHTWDVSQSCLTELDNFEESGCGEFNHMQHSEDINADCDCRPISSQNRGRVDTNCDCDCVSCLDSDKARGQRHVDDPDWDIEHRVSKEVEKALSDILSDVVNRCISSSLKSCISIE